METWHQPKMRLTRVRPDLSITAGEVKLSPGDAWALVLMHICMYAPFKHVTDNRSLSLTDELSLGKVSHQGGNFAITEIALLQRSISLLCICCFETSRLQFCRAACGGREPALLIFHLPLLSCVAMGEKCPCFILSHRCYFHFLILIIFMPGFKPAACHSNYRQIKTAELPESGMCCPYPSLLRKQKLRLSFLLMLIFCCRAVSVDTFCPWEDVGPLLVADVLSQH